MDQIPADVLEFIAMRSRPCLLRCDGTGRILDRLRHPASPVPADIATADGLDSCLSRAVREEWVAIIHDVICSNGMIDAIVVLDGVGLEFSCSPAQVNATSRSVWITLLRATQDFASGSHGNRRTLHHHEWGSLDLLSRCQLDTLRHITLGLANQQIANVMHRSKRAVEWHIRHIHRLLGASARESLARLGRHAGLDSFLDGEWSAVLATRPARRTVEDFARAHSERVG